MSSQSFYIDASNHVPAFECMQLIVTAFVTLFVWRSAAQPLSTNLPTIDQAVKIASQLEHNMRERQVTAFVERNGLRCLLYQAGGSLNWSNFCPLTNDCYLELNFHQNGLLDQNSPFAKWEYGFLNGVFIQSNAVRIVTISLTNSAAISNAP